MAWAMGEVPLLLVMIAILFQWFRSDAREAKRFDRAEDRTEDAALEAYNAQPARPGRHTANGGTPTTETVEIPPFGAADRIRR